MHGRRSSPQEVQADRLRRRLWPGLLKPPVIRLRGRYHQSLWLKDQLDGAITGVRHVSAGPGNDNGHSGGHVNAATDGADEL